MGIRRVTDQMRNLLFQLVTTIFLKRSDKNSGAVTAQKRGALMSTASSHLAT